MKIIKNPFERLQKAAVASLFVFPAIMLMMAGGISSCKNDMSDIDFGNIEKLYEKPLPVIQEAVQGKWKLQYITGGLWFQKFDAPDDIYIYLTKNRIIMGSGTEVTTDSPIIWKWTKDFFGGGSQGYLLTYNHVISISEQDGVIYKKVPIYNSLVPFQIQNDTLVLAEVCCDGYLFCYTRIQNSLNSNH